MSSAFAHGAPARRPADSAAAPCEGGRTAVDGSAPPAAVALWVSGAAAGIVTVAAGGAGGDSREFSRAFADAFGGCEAALGGSEALRVVTNMPAAPTQMTPSTPKAAIVVCRF